MINHPILLSLIQISFIALSIITGSRTYQSECVSLDTNGYITIRIWDPKKGSNYQIEQARKDSIHSLLLSGVAEFGGCSTQSPILASSEDRLNFEKIQKSFFANKGKWSMFVRSSSIAVTLPTSIGSENWKVYQVSISKTELRKYLEEQKIIKSLTYGF